MPDEAESPLSDNAALNQMVETLEAILLLEQGAYDSVSGSTVLAALTDVLATLRAAEPLALKTIVTNGGSDPIQVFEGTILICIVPAFDSRELPLSAQGIIKAKCDTGDSSFVAIATYKQTAV